MQEPRTENREPEDRDLLSPKSSAVVGGRWSVVADALALPLREGCCDTAFCIAALGLFADQRVALRELRRVLRPGAPAVLAVGTQAWAKAIPWPPDLSARLATAYAQALAHGAAPIPAAPDLGGELAELLADSGFAAPLVRAFWLDRGSGIGDQESGANDQRQTGFPDPRPLTPDPCLASELPLLPWPALRPLLADRLPVAELARCDALAAAPEIELCALALVALAHAGG